MGDLYRGLNAIQALIWRFTLVDILLMMMKINVPLCVLFFNKMLKWSILSKRLIILYRSFGAQWWTRKLMLARNWSYNSHFVDILLIIPYSCVFFLQYHAKWSYLVKALNGIVQIIWMSYSNTLPQQRNENIMCSLQRAAGVCRGIIQSLSWLFLHIIFHLRTLSHPK